MQSANKLSFLHCACFVIPEFATSRTANLVRKLIGPNLMVCTQGTALHDCEAQYVMGEWIATIISRTIYRYIYIYIYICIHVHEKQRCNDNPNIKLLQLEYLSIQTCVTWRWQKGNWFAPLTDTWNILNGMCRHACLIMWTSILQIMYIGSDA